MKILLFCNDSILIRTMGLIGLLCDSPKNRVTFAVEDIGGEKALVVSAPNFLTQFITFSPGSLDSPTWMKEINGVINVIISLCTSNRDDTPDYYRGIPSHKCRFNVLLRALETYDAQKPGTYDKLLNPGTVWIFVYQTINEGKRDTDLTYYEYVVPNKPILEDKLKNIFS